MAPSCVRNGLAERALARLGILASDEDGASYSLPFVLVLPFYAFLVALVVECALMSLVKIGTLQAAYAAARAASVWLPSEIPTENRRAMVHLAAIQAMWPWASGSQRHAAAGQGSFRLDPYASQAAAESIAACRCSSGGKLDQDYLERKWLYAAKATEVDVRFCPAPDDREGPTELTVTVQYEMPINTPGLGLLMGHAPSWPSCPFRTRMIASTVTLEAEMPQSADRQDRRLGIHYYDNPGYSTGGVLVRTTGADGGGR